MKKLFISFSARENGNCDSIAYFLSGEQDAFVYFRDKKYHACAGCDYECFDGRCKYRGDDVYELFDSMQQYQKIIFIVPMYCGNPSSLYFAFCERSQDYFTQNGDKYNDLIKKLFIIGIYGDKYKSPNFVSCLEKWFEGSKYSNHVLGIERHKFNLKLKDSVLDVEEARAMISEFINPKSATEELSAMAVVLHGESILTTSELIYDKIVLSLPKGHKEEGESLVEAAIRECFEETNIIISENDLVRELAPYSYEFLTPSNKLIRKTIAPFLFTVNDKGAPIAKEKRVISVNWMNKDEFLDKCTHENVKNTVKTI